MIDILRINFRVFNRGRPWPIEWLCDVHKDHHKHRKSLGSSQCRTKPWWRFGWALWRRRTLHFVADLAAHLLPPWASWAYQRDKGWRWVWERPVRQSSRSSVWFRASTWRTVLCGSQSLRVWKDQRAGAHSRILSSTRQVCIRQWDGMSLNQLLVSI